jgi:hypothetical protein
MTTTQEAAASISTGIERVEPHRQKIGIESIGDIGR